MDKAIQRPQGLAGASRNNSPRPDCTLKPRCSDSKVIWRRIGRTNKRSSWPGWLALAMIKLIWNKRGECYKATPDPIAGWNPNE